MTHHTHPARTPLTLCLAALALLSACAFAPRSTAAQTPVMPKMPPVGPLTADGHITKEWLLDALRSRQHGEEELVRFVESSGSSFLPTAEDKKELRAAGAADRLLEAVRKNYRRMMAGEGFGPGGGGFGSGGGPGNAGPVDYTRPFRQSEVTRKALITFKPQPGFTEDAHKNNVTGVVRLRAILHSEGKVTNIVVVKGLPDGLTEKAVAAARRIKFTPAQKDGRKVSQYVVLEYVFAP